MSDKTVHSLVTEHGLDTFHKLPTDSVTVTEILRDLSVQLYPTGRAWYMPENGVFQSMHDAFNLSFARLIDDNNQTIDSTFPDNDNFTDNDAELWEYRLGLITNTSLSLDVRKQNISRKLGHPNNIKARQHPLFIQNQLQLSGFDLFVHENVKPYKTPTDIVAASLNNTQHGGSSQHGNSEQHGSDNFSVIANSIDPNEDYAVGIANLWASFFISGAVLGDMVNVPASRERELRELVIKLKPAHTAAYIFINFV